MDPITEKQYDYIKILSNYEATREEDQKDIESYLHNASKKDLSELSKQEASKLIQKLLERSVEHEFICGRKTLLHKREVNSFIFLGEMEACMHHCPDSTINGDINICEDYMKFNK